MKVGSLHTFAGEIAAGVHDDDLEQVDAALRAAFDALRDRRTQAGKERMRRMSKGTRVVTLDGIQGVPAGLAATVTRTYKTNVGVRFDDGDPKWGGKMVRLPASCVDLVSEQAPA